MLCDGQSETTVNRNFTRCRKFLSVGSKVRFVSMFIKIPAVIQTNDVSIKKKKKEREKKQNSLLIQ